MALNFQGVGFSFVAKDKGLLPLQQKIATGFFDMSASVTRLHKQTQPAFANMGVGLGKVEMTLARQEKRVAEWSENFVKGIDKVGEKASKIAEPFVKSYEAIGSGVRVVANTWQNTFGKSFDTLGTQISGIGTRLKGIVDATKPIQQKFEAVWKKAAGAMKPFSDAFSRAKDKIHEFLGKSKETDEEQERETGRYEKRSKVIVAATKTIQVGFDGIKGVMTKLNQVLRVNKLRGFMEAISVGMLSKIAGGIDKLGSAGMNLTTGLEGQMVGMAKSAKQTAANLGLTGKALRDVQGRAAGMALGLNIGAEQATKAIVGFQDSLEEMRMVGITSAEDLAKLGETMGVDAQQFSFMLKNMKTLGMGAKEIQAVIGSFTAMGQETRDVSGALGSLGEIMKVVEAKASLMGEAVDPKQLAALAQQTAAYGAALGKMGKTSDEARSLSLGMAQALVENQKQFQNLFSGTADNIPQLATELGIATGDIDTAFSLMSQGPAGFVQGLQELVKSAERSGSDVGQVMDFVRARLENAGIQGVEPLITFLRSADKQVIKTMGSVSNATADLGKLAKEGFSTGRTLAEAFDLAKESAIAHFRAGGKAGATFLKDFTASASKFNKILDETSKKGGPLGNFVDKLRDVHRLGAAGLLPKEMQGAGILLAEIGQQLGPLLGVLGGAILFFPGLTAVLGPVVTVLGLFAINLFKAKLAGESWGEAFQTAFDDTLATISKFVDYAKKALPKIIDAVKDVLPGIISAIMEVAPKIFEAWSSIQNTIVEMVIKYAPKLVDAFVKVVGVVVENFGKLAPKLIQAFVGLVQAIAKALPSIVPKLVEVFGVVLDAVIKGLVTLVPQLVDVVVEVIPTLIKGISDALPKIIQAIATLAPVLIQGFVSLLVSLASELPDLLGKLIPAVIQGLQAIIMAIIENAPKLIQALLDAIVGFAEKLPELFPQLIGALIDLIPPLLKGLAKVIVSLADALPKILPPLLDALIKGILLIVEKLPEILPELVQALITVFEALTKWLPQILPIVVKAFTQLFLGLVKALPPILPALVKGIIDLLVAAIPMLAVAIWEIAKELWGMLFGDDNIISMIIGGLVDLVVGIAKELWNLFDEYILEPLGDIWTLLELPSLDEMWTALTDAAEAAWDAIAETFDDLFVKPIKFALAVIDEIWKFFFGESMSDSFDEAIGTYVGIWEDFWGVIEDFWDWITKTAKKVLDGMSRAWKSLKDAVLRVWDAIWSKVEWVIDAIEKAWNQLKMDLAAIFASIYMAAKKLWDDIVDAAGKVWDRIKEAWGDVKKFFGDLFDGILQPIKDAMAPVYDAVVDIWDDGKGGGIKGAWGKVSEWFEGLWNDIKRIALKIWGMIRDKVEEAIGPLIALFDKIAEISDTIWGNSIHDDANESMQLMAKYTSEQTSVMDKTWASWSRSLKDIIKKTFDHIEREISSFGNKTNTAFLEISMQMVADFADAFAVIDQLASYTDFVLTTMTIRFAQMLQQVEGMTHYLWKLAGDIQKAAKESEDAVENLEGMKGKAVRTVHTHKFEGAAFTQLADAINEPKWWKDSKEELKRFTSAQIAFLDLMLKFLHGKVEPVGGIRGTDQGTKKLADYLAQAQDRLAKMKGKKPPATEVSAPVGTAQ